MNGIRTLSIAAALGALLLAAPAFAQHGGFYRGPGVRFGVNIGVPLFPYYGAPYAYAPYYPPYNPPVVIQSAPPVYVEQQGNAMASAPPAASAPASNDLFFCSDSKTYYPYVTQCASPWQRVTPQAPQAMQSPQPSPQPAQQGAPR